ncbi:c-type cytochrome [Thalassotalea ponticola]|uniref:c-type cytochrome n=1 Tax=Thalassotalea ponticola TaxID=1523392 RepID=UPI0025B5E8A5|nr:c-type cytochrome [Thalassotalea ponticola]MDN3652975.1 c-type cytochrome [Thalassotalea ponticola]
MIRKITSIKLLSLALVAHSSYAWQPIAIDDPLFEQGMLMAEAEIAEEQLAQQKLRQHIRYCAPCHGIEGRASLAIYPDLAGQGEQQLFIKMQYYRDQLEEQKVKQPMMLRFSDDELRALAHYFAQFKAAEKE